jgi:hypothetical protein
MSLLILAFILAAFVPELLLRFVAAAFSCLAWLLEGLGRLTCGLLGALAARLDRLPKPRPRP